MNSFVTNYLDMPEVVKHPYHEASPLVFLRGGGCLLARLLVLKLGGSLVTEKRRGGAVREEALRRLGSELAAVDRPLIIVHGGGGRVHEVAGEYQVALGRGAPRGLEGFIRTSIETRRLNLQVTEILADAGLRCIGLPSTPIYQTRRGRIATAGLDPILAALDQGLTPVLNGDVVFDREIGFTVLSGDAVAVDLSLRLGAERLVFATDVDGIFEHPGEGARLLSSVDKRTLASVRFGDVGDVTGGMASKVEEALRAAEGGVEVYVVNGLVPSRVVAALLGRETIGTRILG
ncbi:MAG: isopentenyl phosphate kinase [Nitrososphaerota archaeon]